MPDQLTNVIISKVYEGKSGEGKFGPYTAYNFYVQGEDKKFGWFGGPKKITPVEGMEIAYMEYTTEQDGKYTNYKVSKLVLKEEKSNPTAIANAKEDLGPIPKATNNRDASFYVAYASQMWCAMVSRLPEEIVNDMVLSKEAKLVTQIGLDMMTIVTGNTPSEAQNTPLEESEPEPEPTAGTKLNIIDPDGIPKVVCTYKGASFKGKEILTMYCKSQCEFKDSCPTAKQLREAE